MILAGDVAVCLLLSAHYSGYSQISETKETKMAG